MYSPAARPSSTRAAPAKKRSWSTITGSSSDVVSPIGLPVFADSTSTSPSPLASTASAMRSNANWRCAGVVSRQVSNALAAARTSLSTSSAPATGASHYAAGDRVDDVRLTSGGRPAVLAADEVLQLLHGGS
jgi:hypothetical protein